MKRAASRALNPIRLSLMTTKILRTKWWIQVWHTTLTTKRKGMASE